MQKNILKNFLNNASEDHPLFSYNYTIEEHEKNLDKYKKIWLKVVRQSNNVINYDIGLDCYYNELLKYYYMVEVLLEQEIKDINNYLVEIIILNWEMLNEICKKDYRQIYDELLDVYDIKNWDYNNAAELQLMYSGIDSFKTTIEHKIFRLKSFYNNDEIKVEDEKVMDTIMDLINYCMIYLIWADKGYPTI